MSWISWIFTLVLVAGFVLFLIGANFYEMAVGFAGLFFVVVGVIGLLVLYVYRELTKSTP